MNGGRLSNDATFLLGVAEFRAQLGAPAPDAEAVERALTRIAIRYPEEAEELGALWHSRARAECGALLARVEAHHQGEDEE